MHKLSSTLPSSHYTRTISIYIYIPPTHWEDAPNCPRCTADLRFNFLARVPARPRARVDNPYGHVRVLVCNLQNNSQVIPDGRYQIGKLCEETKQIHIQPLYTIYISIQCIHMHTCVSHVIAETVAMARPAWTLWNKGLLGSALVSVWATIDGNYSRASKGAAQHPGDRRPPAPPSL